MKTAIVLILSMLAQAAGNTCLSKGMKAVGAESVLGDGFSPLVILRALQDPLIWLGILFLLLFFVFFAAALSWEDLSFVLPASSFGYILNVAFAAYFLGEPVSATRWAGTGLIFLGVVLVSRTAKSTEKPLRDGSESLPDTGSSPC